MHSRYFLLPSAGLVLMLVGCSSPQPASPVAAAPAKLKVDFGATELTPVSGSGNEATFTLTLRGGSEKPAMIGLLINDRQNGEGACYVFRNLTNDDNIL